MAGGRTKRRGSQEKSGARPAAKTELQQEHSLRARNQFGTITSANGSSPQELGHVQRERCTEKGRRKRMTEQELSPVKERLLKGIRLHLSGIRSKYKRG